MPTNYLLVPIQIDALFVHDDEYPVLDQIADFTVLPYVDPKEGDINSDTANISEMILSQSFSNRNLRLGSGVHLHWAMPDAMAKGEQNGDDMEFPEIPNRWLVTRKKSGKVQKQWIVESDYLYAESIDKKGVAVSIPYGKGTQAYRYLGRQMPLSVWQAKDNSGEYLDQLTVTGYGEATFAAFYPNCFSVLGFHDKEIKDLNNIQYEVIGWYDDPSKDILNRFINVQQDQSYENIKELISEEFKWELPKSGTTPQNIACFAKLSFNQNFDPTYPAEKAQPKITVANTPTEALSASIADKLKKGENEEEIEKSLKFIEDQLEAVQLLYQLNRKKLDIVSRFRELRHENGFTARTSAYLWTIGKEKNSAALLDQEQTVSTALPESIVIILKRVNEIQKNYDKGIQEIASMRTQLFADWYKYMICVYPPDRFSDDYPAIDEVKNFIELKGINPLNELIKKVGTFEVIENTDGVFQQVTAGNSDPNSFAAHLVQEINNLLLEISKINQIEKENYTYYLRQTPGPRFWEPNDPVVLIEGEGVELSQRHGEDGNLSTSLFASTVSISENDFKEIRAKVNAIKKSSGIQTKEKQPWNPFLLDWEVQFYPLEAKSNLHLNKGTYDSEFIKFNYEAPVVSHDLELKQGKGAVVKFSSVYEGSSILTNQATALLINQIEDHIAKQGLKETYENEKNTSLDLTTQLNDFKSWYEAREDKKPSILVQLNAYEIAQNLTCLSQSIGGLNEAMLMLKQTIEMGIEDPLAFGEDNEIDSYKYFTNDKVNKTVADNLLNAPAPLNDFHPIRAGVLKINQLRLVDTFGQVKELSCENIDTTYKMTTPGNKYLIKLPPRVSQPARLNFRWLASNSQDELMTDDAKQSPILGWFLTNKLDRSLMVYGSDGKAYGYFKAGRWYEAIDSELPLEINEIPDEHLKRAVQFIQRAIDEDTEKDNPDVDKRFLSHFINTIDDALDNIQPETTNEQQGISLLIGKPVALVRASVNLELLGLPAINQKWDVFRQDMEQNRRTSDGFTKVEFPVRIGEYGQLNDGLIGYWLEDEVKGETQFRNDVFYSPQSDYIDTNKIESQYDSPDVEDGPINFYQSIADRPQFLSILMQPQGSLHATVGILPNKEISIPENQFADALDNIETSFLTAPILTQKGKIQLPLSTGKDYEWSWVERATYKPKESWSEVFAIGELNKELFNQRMERLVTKEVADNLWNYLLDEAVVWLTHIEGDNLKAQLTPKEKRKSQEFEMPFMGLEKEVQDIFDNNARYIEPAITEGKFLGESEIREGWLKIRKKED